MSNLNQVNGDMLNHGTSSNNQFAQYLEQASSDARKRHKETPAKVLHDKLSAAYKKAMADGPSPNYRNEIDDITKQIDESIKSSKPSTGWRAYFRGQAEETMSKTFLRRFKAKHSSREISELHVTPDWNQPDNKTGVAKGGANIADVCSFYYKWLFDKKLISQAHKQVLMHKLEQRQLSDKVRESCEGLIKEEEVIAAIRQSANGKACGPDGLPMELYKLFEKLLAPKICVVLNEAFMAGALPDSMRAGEIILLYKKKDPRDLRNYRPITLLNADYNLLGKVLGARMKKAVDEIISPNQLGFVPKRVITEASHLTKLIQAYLDETDEEGLLVALDMEKAFDRC